MSVINEDYYQEIQNRIAEIRSVKMHGVIKQPDYTQVKNRTALIFTLECILEAHRKVHATIFSPLKGKAALEHLILQKYKWPLSEIRGLSLEDSVFIIQDELAFEKLPKEAMDMIDFFASRLAKKVFPTIMDNEWDPELYDKFLEKH